MGFKKKKVVYTWHFLQAGLPPQVGVSLQRRKKSKYIKYNTSTLDIHLAIWQMVRGLQVSRVLEQLASL
jgi:hypothetical protein